LQNQAGRHNFLAKLSVLHVITQVDIIDFTGFLSKASQNVLCKVGCMSSMDILSIEAGAFDVLASRSALPCSAVYRYGSGLNMATLGAAAP